MARYFIGITGISTAGKSTLAATLLSDNISPKVFPIPHTTRRKVRPDDDPRLIRCITEQEFEKSEFFTVDQNYGTLTSDYNDFLASDHLIAVSVVSCNEVPDLREKVLDTNIIPIFISLTLTKSLKSEENAIKQRFPTYFSGKALSGRIQRDYALARNFFFNEKYLEYNHLISLSQEAGGVLNWISMLQNYVPISYNQQLASDIEAIKSVRN